MDKEYLAQLENSQMKKRLLTLDNIPAIEDILDRESRRLRRLHQLKRDNKLDLGGKVSAEELAELFPKICTEVDNFLGIQGHNIPTCSYFNLFQLGWFPTYILSSYAILGVEAIKNLTPLVMNQNIHQPQLLELGANAMLFIGITGLHSMAKNDHYNKSSKKITLSKTVRTDLISAAGHEYTHSIQDNNGINKLKHRIFMEGHARGVEKHLANIYHEREDNEAFLYDITDTNVGELKSAYKWMCKQLAQQPKHSLLKTKTSRDSDENFESLIFRKPSPHAIGNALFSIYEERKGNDIYDYMIHGYFQFPPSK